MRPIYRALHNIFGLCRAIFPPFIVSALITITESIHPCYAYQSQSSLFGAVQLYEPFTLIYRVNGQLMPDGTPASEITISANQGRLLYAVNDSSGTPVLAAIYDGRETYAYGQLSPTQAAILPGFQYDQFSTMPLPGTGLPGIPISNLDVPQYRMKGKAAQQTAEIIQKANLLVPISIRKAANVQEALEQVPLPCVHGFPDEPVIYSLGTIGWTHVRVPQIHWATACGPTSQPKYMWVYSKHVPFQGQWLASKIRFVHPSKGASDHPLDCTLSLASASKTPLPDDFYSLVHYLPKSARIDDMTRTPEVVIEYKSDGGSLDSQEARAVIIDAANKQYALSKKHKVRPSAGIVPVLTCVLALVFGMAGWYVIRIRKALR